MPYATSSHFAYHKTKWSTSLRSRHIVDLALSESDQSLRSPGPAQIPSPAIPDRSSAQPSPSSSTSSPQFKRPKTVNVPDFNQPKNQAQADSEWGVSTNVEECTSGTKKLLMELGINKLGEAREILYVIEIEDTEHDIMSQDFPCLITNRSALDPESGSSYDDSEFSDDDDAEYLVTSAKRRFSRIYQTMRSYHLRPDRENYKIVLNLLEGLEHKGHCVTMDNYYNSPALARYLKCRGFDCLGTERLTRKNIPEDVKEMKKNCEKGTIIACHSGDVMVLAGCKILSMISTFHDNSTYTGTSAGEECEKPICVKDCNTTMGALI
ncbi:PiggyBac transposable element-derived protein 4 [Eumeta japonica]|uniref:PiggyBac transposable element-derived protein 4 n=1 Tax=Eumeta variegata TaxID=151549 RepID=A0A4C1T222_EUMVA|nr:PiggyBac transposable element-derived protein 4 [Eumeta japonica]